MKISAFYLLLLIVSVRLYAQDSLVIWQARLDRNTSVPTIISGDKYFCSSLDGVITCLDNNGKIVKEYEITGQISSPPIIENEMIIAATNEGDLFILNVNTGNIIQEIGIGENITSNIVLTDVEYYGKTGKAILLGTADGNLYCYDLYTLEQIWSTQTTADSITSSILPSGNNIFFIDTKETLYCVNRANGLLIWKWKIPFKNSEPLFKTDLVINQNNLYLVSSEGNLICIDAMQGTEKWSIKKINASGLMRSDRNNLIVPTTKNKLLFVSTKAGKVEKEIELAPETKEHRVTELLVMEDNVLVGFENGSVYELSKNKKPVEIFRAANLPARLVSDDSERDAKAGSRIISLNMINGNFLITSENGLVSLITSGN